MIKYLRNRRIKKHAAEIAHILGNLQSGDIIMVHTKGSLLSAVIRRLTKSYWNHSALVLTNFSHLPEYKTTIVIEVQDEGVIAHRIGAFLDPKKFDIAVKRVPFLDEAEKNLVKHYLLAHIDVPYDTTRLIGVVLGMLTGRTFSQFINTHQVICSSLIQKAFYHAVPEAKRPEVIFAHDFKNEDDLELTSPADIARSDKAVWIYNPHNHH